MAGPFDDKYTLFESELNSFKSFNDSKAAETEITSREDSNIEQSANKVISDLQNLEKKNKEFQRKIKNQLEKLTDIGRSLPGFGFSGKSNNDNLNHIKSIFVRSLTQIVSEIPQIIVDEMISEVGCSQEQTYLGSPLGIYIPVKSVDIFGMLKINPNSPIGKISYENSPATNVNFRGRNPFNKQLYSLLQNTNRPFSQEFNTDYLGFSTQNLFDIEYTTINNLNQPGHYFKVTLLNRQPQNLISEFLVDYFKTIQITNIQNIIAIIFELLSGFMSIEIGLTSKQVEVQTRFQIILQRIMGLCFDDRSEIDVSGNAKVSPTNAIDNSFFEFTDIDLREINTIVNNVISGVMEFEDCDNLKVPVNSEEILQSVLETLQINENNSEQISQVFNNTQNTLQKHLKLLLPSINIQANIDLNILSAIPKGIFMSILTPKVLLPFYIMIISSRNNMLSEISEITDSFEFIKKFRRFAIQIMSKIVARYVQILRDIIVKELKIILRTIVSELRKNAATKKYAMIITLIEAGLIINKLIQDYRRCESVIDEMLDLIRLALTSVRIDLPGQLMPLARFKAGFSDVRAFLNVTKQLQKLGVPTGPMPSGKPNIGMLVLKNSIVGIESERIANGKTQITTNLGTIQGPFVLPIQGFGQSF